MNGENAEVEGDHVIAYKDEFQSDANSASKRPPVRPSPDLPIHTSPSPSVPESARPGVPGLPISASPRRRVAASALKWLVHLSRFGLAALFLFTAGAKLAIIKIFAVNVSELLAASGFNYEKWMWPTTIGVIVAEVFTAVLLLFPRTVRLGAICAAALLIGFAAYALYYVYMLNGEPLECGCFGGILASQLGVTTALRNLALLIPTIIVFAGYKSARRFSPTA